MPDVRAVIDKFSGFITKEQAEYILNADADQHLHNQRRTNSSVKELLDLANISKKQRDTNVTSESSSVNIKDYLYRIFNPQTVMSKVRESVKRTIVLGEEGYTLPLNLGSKLSEFIDINIFERGDLVVITNASFNPVTGILTSNGNTAINRISPSKIKPVNDYSSIKGELRRVDLVGRMVEISPIRHVNKIGGRGQIAVASCVITDSVNLVDASFWGSSALATTLLKPNDFIKIEFCDVRLRDEGKVHIYANDSSRVIASNSFSKRLIK